MLKGLQNSEKDLSKKLDIFLFHYCIYSKKEKHNNFYN